MDELPDQVIVRNAEPTPVEVKKRTKEKNRRAQEKPEESRYSLERRWEEAAWDWRCALNEF